MERKATRSPQHKKGKIQHSVTIKTFSKLRIGRKFLNMINGIYENPTANNIRYSQ